jgi:hypothetical protein
MNKELRQELERLARSEAPSGRAALAKAQALRLLERLDREGDVDYPVDDDGRFHPGPPEFWDLDRQDSDDKRERWKRSWLADRLNRPS